MVNYPFVVAGVVGLLYVLIWAVYRLARWWQYRQYRNTHREEFLRRAKADHENAKLVADRDRHRRQNAEEFRRKEWDAEHGPLMQPMQLSEREESRWPVGAALQGAAAVTTSLLVAGMIWGEGGNPPPPVVQPSGPTDVSSVAIPLSLVVSAILALLGGALLYFPRSKALRVVGGASLLTMSLLSGLKVLPVEQICKDLFSIQELTVFRYTRTSVPLLGESSRPTISLAVDTVTITQVSGGKEPVPPPVPFALTVTFPPFDSGAAEPDARLRCAFETFARELAADPTISSIVLVGRADRRELRPPARHKYASNWGLAQHRGAYLENVLKDMQVPPSKILVTTAGPLLTSPSIPSSALGRDRVVTAWIFGSGTPPPWASRFASGAEWALCETGTRLANNPSLHQ